MFPLGAPITTNQTEEDSHQISKKMKAYVHTMFLSDNMLKDGSPNPGFIGLTPNSKQNSFYPNHKTVSTMKKHLIFSICLLSFLTLTLSNCTHPGIDPDPSIGTSIAPKFMESGSTTNSFDNLTRDFVRVSTSLSSQGSSVIIQHGHVWSPTGYYPELRIDPEGKLTYSELGAISASEVYPYRFTSYVKGLKAGTTYTVRAYVTTKDGTFYSDSSEFKTLDNAEN